jgi:hypothetical protein
MQRIEVLCKVGVGFDPHYTNCPRFDPEWRGLPERLQRPIFGAFDNEFVL